MKKVYKISNGGATAWCDTLQQAFDLIVNSSEVESFEELELNQSDKESVEDKFIISLEVVSDKDYDEIMSIEFDGFV